MANLKELKTQIENANALGIANLTEKGVDVSAGATTYEIMSKIADVESGGGNAGLPIEITVPPFAIPELGITSIDARCEFYSPPMVLTSTGTQYIDTGYKPKPNSWYKVLVSFKYKKDKEVGFIFGGRKSATDENTSLNLGDPTRSNIAVGRGNYYADLTKTGWKEDTFHEFIVKPDIVTIDGRVICTDVSNLSREATYSIYLFGCNQMGSLAVLNNDNSPRNIVGKMKYFQIYEGEILVHDFVPCLSQESGHENEACLYDNVTETYFYNKGTGTFAYEGA